MANESHLSALSPGHRLHWYQVERVLGQGGFGITYLARDLNLDQAVAIKEYLPVDIAVRAADGTIQPRSGADAEHFRWGMERFLAEARTLARFNHSNIIHVFSVFEANHTAYMVMRYEEGESLRAILKQRKHLTEEELLGICLPICEGLAKVHATGFIHRDIQPSNIYIRDDSSPVLLDFGAARRTMGNPRTLTILVAPGYAPIEQYYSSGAEQGPWTDIYGLGATMYRAVAGTAPIDAIERSRGMLGSSRDMLVPASVVGSGRYSDRFLRAIDHALRFNDKERPRTLAEWMVELRGTGTPAAPPVPQPPQSLALPEAAARDVAGPARKAPPAVAQAPVQTRSSLAGLLLAAALLGTVALWYFVAREPATPAPASATRSAPAPAGNSPDRQATAPVLPAAPVTADTSPAPAATPPVKEPAPEPAQEAPQPQLAGGQATVAVATIAGADPVDQDKAELAALVESLKEETARLAALQKASQRPPAPATEPASRPSEPPAKSADAAPATTPAGNDTAAAATTTAQPVESPTGKTLESGLGAIAAGNFESAMGQLLPLARSGNPEAQFQVAMMYRNGQGVLANNPGALEWLRRSAWQNHADAQVGLARLYADGIDGRRDHFLAYVWYLRAERNGALTMASERAEVEKHLQPEQLPQAMALALSLNGPAPMKAAAAQ